MGGHETLRTDARVVAATNRNLEEAVREGRFRSDLFFRLNVFPIRVPALRERTEDIPLLAEYWASRYARTVGKGIRRIDESAMGALCAYPWPGNIRELQNVVERAVILARGSVLGLGDFELPSLRSEPHRPSRHRRRRAPADRRGARREPRPRLWRRRRGGGARCAAQHAGVAHPPPRDRQARLPPPRARPLANGPPPQGTRGGGRRETLQQLKRSHRDGERGGKQLAQDEDRPPGRGQRGSALGRAPKNFHSCRSRIRFRTCTAESTSRGASSIRR